MSLNYDKSMEQEILSYLPDDMVTLSATVDKADNWLKQLIHDLFFQSNKVISEYPNFTTLFVNKFTSELNKKADELVREFLIKIELRLETSRQTAIDTLLSNRYSSDLRVKMLEHFDKEEYSNIAYLALEYDGAIRDRPNKGKKGPDNPLEVGEELHHINYGKIMNEYLAASPKNISRLREETNTSMIVCAELLRDHRYSYERSKQMILEVLKEIKDRGSAEDWDAKELKSLPSWKSNIIKGERRLG